MNLFVNNLCKVAVLDYLHPSVTQLTLVSYYGHPREKDVNVYYKNKMTPNLLSIGPLICVTFHFYFSSGVDCENVESMKRIKVRKICG